MTEITQIAAPLSHVASALSASPAPAKSSIGKSPASSDARHEIITDLADVMRRLFLYLNQALQKIGDELDSRRQTVADVTAAQTALDHIKNFQNSPYDPSLFNVAVPLEAESPAEGKNLWSLLVYYGLKKQGDSPPANEAELDALIGDVKTKGTAASSLAAAINQKITMMNRTRENYVSLLSELIMGDVKLMRSIINML
ncbi:hypothetical protein D9O50_04625 [Oxalobacteraceae bacterium CAVE-383]|nr:hypothetical protein D9O50_04625 [Oxalobacteraceae bacterium CAVE-383]